jgi:hypothetical protein
MMSFKIFGFHYTFRITWFPFPSLIPSFLPSQASTTLCGLTVGVTVVFELPIFQYSKPLLARMGYHAMFMVAMLCYIVRVYGYTLLTPATVQYGRP